MEVFFCSPDVFGGERSPLILGGGGRLWVQYCPIVGYETTQLERYLYHGTVQKTGT